MSLKVTQERLKEIEDESYILSDGEMSAEFRQFLSDYRIEVRVWKHPRTNFDYDWNKKYSQLFPMRIVA